jgi:hypothetical protein
VVVSVSAKDRAAAVLEYSRFAFRQIRSRIDDARRYAAQQLLDYYNYYNAHLKDGEQLKEEEFIARLALEGIRFSSNGAARLDFQHSLYGGDHINEGGLIVVETAVDGRIRQAYWVTKSDAEECRRVRNCT